MTTEMPKPEVKTMLVCRNVIQDRYTGTFVLIGPTHEVSAPQYPATFDLSIFLDVTSVRGSYLLAVQLRDISGNELSRFHMTQPMVCHDPLKVGSVGMLHYAFVFPEPGKYEIAVFANGEEIAAVVFWAYQQPSPMGPPTEFTGS